MQNCLLLTMHCCFIIFVKGIVFYWHVLVLKGNKKWSAIIRGITDVKVATLRNAVNVLSTIITEHLVITTVS